MRRAPHQVGQHDTGASKDHADNRREAITAVEQPIGYATPSTPPQHRHPAHTADAIDIARAAAADPVAAEPMSVARMLVPALVLTGEFDEALHYANAMWHTWQTTGRTTAGWLWFPAATAALAHGLTGDQDGYRRWRQRMSDLAGPQNAHRLRTASSAHFADARIAVHTGDLTDAATLVEATFSDPVPGHRFRVFAWPAAAELAVVAGLPEAPRYSRRRRGPRRRNGWATACLARARGRYHHDPDTLRESVATWEHVGARFEHDYTLRLLDDHAG